MESISEESCISENVEDSDNAETDQRLPQPDNDVLLETAVGGSVFSVLPVDDETQCITAISTLLISFSFWMERDEKSSRDVARSLLDRRVRVRESLTALWEITKVPEEVQELSTHFQLVLDGEDSPMVRLTLTDGGLGYFSRALLGACTSDGGVFSIPCTWSKVCLTVFPHGAILQITVDWTSEAQQMRAVDFRMRMHLARLMSIQEGVCTGWAFVPQEPVSSPELLEEARELLGVNLHAALYGGGSISLSSAVNWLVKLGDESSHTIPRRVARHEVCHHHAFVRVRGTLLRPKRIWHFGNSELSQLSSEESLFELWPKCFVEISLGGILAVEPDLIPPRQSHLKQFMSIFELLTVHCLSERWVLTKLLYLVAVSPDITVTKSRIETDCLRRSVMTLAKDLALYNSSMASADCGGRHEYYSFFKQLRQSFSIEVLKQELHEVLHDTLAVVKSTWLQARRADHALELYWKNKVIKNDRNLELNCLQRQHRLDITFYTITAAVTPFIVVASVFGMNNIDTPRQVPWGYCLLASGMFAVVLLIIVWINLNRTGPQMRALAEEKLHHRKLHLGLLVPVDDALNEEKTL